MNTQDTQNILNELQKMEQFSSHEAHTNVRKKINKIQKQKRRRRRFILSSTITSAAAVVMLVFWLQFNLTNVHNTSNKLPRPMKSMYSCNMSRFLSFIGRAAECTCIKPFKGAKQPKSVTWANGIHWPWATFWAVLHLWAVLCMCTR